MKLYTFPGSPHCLKVHAVAYELGIELEVVTVDIFKRETEHAWFLALNPNGLVPVLVEGDFVLWESNAIITYFARLHGWLPASARDRAEIDRWLYWHSAHLMPTLARLVFERFAQSADESPQSALARHCAVLEASLGDRAYVANVLSIADFALACGFHTATMIAVDLRPFPRIVAWLQRILERESLRRARADAERSLLALYGP